MKLNSMYLPSLLPPTLLNESTSAKSAWISSTWDTPPHHRSPC